MEAVIWILLPGFTAVASGLLAWFIMLALVLQFRSEPPAVTRGGHVYVTQVDAEGFQPLPNGAARVVRLEGISQ